MSSELRRMIENNDTSSYNEYLRSLIKSGHERISKVEPPPQRKNLDEASSHIGKFEYWESLSTELKLLIISKMDFSSRIPLMLCSRVNYRIVPWIPITMKSIRIEEQGNDYPEIIRKKIRKKKNVFIELSDETGCKTHICFVKERIDTRIYRYWEEKNKNGVYVVKSKFLEKRNYLEESVSYLEKVMDVVDRNVDELYLSVDEDFDIDFILPEKIRVKNKLTLLIWDYDILGHWLEVARSPLEYLRISNSSYETPRVRFNHEAINNAKELNFSSYESMIRSYYNNLKCDKFSFNETRTSGKHVNRFLKRWVSGDVPENFAYGEFVHKNRGYWRSEVNYILTDIQYSQWDDQFKNENKYLCSLVAKSLYFDNDGYYIENEKRDNRAVLIVGATRAAIVVIGKNNWNSRKRRAPRDASNV